jgi:hypothetical protein
LVRLSLEARASILQILREADFVGLVKEDKKEHRQRRFGWLSVTIPPIAKRDGWRIRAFMHPGVCA